MLKKSLIAIAVLAIALPAVAGDFKTHSWQTTYVAETVNTDIKVIMDVGYYIHIVNQDDIEVSQFDGLAPDESPYNTYWGCNLTDIISNFDAHITMKVTDEGKVGPDVAWKGYFVPAVYDGTSAINQYNHKTDSLNVNNTTVSTLICVLGTDVDLTGLPGGSTDVHVATVDFTVIPN